MSDDLPLIRLRGITKTYGEGNTAFQALKGVDLDIAQGEFLAIMGASGISNPNLIFVGQVLTIPGAGGGATATPVPTTAPPAGSGPGAQLRLQSLGYGYQIER